MEYTVAFQNPTALHVGHGSVGFFTTHAAADQRGRERRRRGAAGSSKDLPSHRYSTTTTVLLTLNEAFRATLVSMSILALAWPRNGCVCLRTANKRFVLTLSHPTVCCMFGSLCALHYPVHIGMAFEKHRPGFSVPYTNPSAVHSATVSKACARFLVCAPLIAVCSRNITKTILDAGADSLGLFGRKNWESTAK